MSKAFTRESEHAPEQVLVRAPLLPPNTPNYMTAVGAKHLREQLENLAALPDLSSNRETIFELQRVLRTAVPVDAPAPPRETVQFGATVTVRDQSGETDTYRIVGVSEMDLDRNWISWLSPLAKALLKAKVGDCVRFLAPGGEQKLEIIAIAFE